MKFLLQYIIYALLIKVFEILIFFFGLYVYLCDYLRCENSIFLNTNRCTLLIRILRPTSWIPSDHNHIIWCLYIPDENEEETIEEEKTSLLVVTHNERVKNVLLFLFILDCFLVTM